MSDILAATDSTFKTEVEDSPIPTLVDFWAPWCGPCRVLSPIIEEIARDFTGRVKVVKLNTDDNPEIATKLRIQSIPTVLLFKDGKIVDQTVGARPKAHFVDMVEKHL